MHRHTHADLPVLRSGNLALPWSATRLWMHVLLQWHILDVCAFLCLALMQRGCLLPNGLHL